MELDPVFLSRVQFVWVVALHILLPAFTVGLSCFIAVLEGLHFFKRDAVYLRLSQYWLRIFAVSFGLGVVSGIVMPFQFGTNWSRFSDATANIIGPLLAYEGLTAFFLEAGFLGVLLFGRKLVPPSMHFAAALLVALGTLISSFWILAANSWMQTPAGHEVIDGRFFPKDWLAIVFNPSFPYRLTHTVNGFFITTGFVVIAVAAYHLRNQRFVDESRRMMSMTLWLLTVLVPLQMVIGDLHGLNTVEYQPVKIAAMEANWETQRRAPMVLFAIPDEAAEANRLEIAIPALASLYLTHSFDGEVKGLKDWTPDDRPPVLIPFFTFRIMVGAGLLMLAVVAASWWLRYRGRLFDTPWFLLTCLVASPLGFIAILAGWFTTEVGRQPWVVYNLMRTRDGVPPSLTSLDVMLSLIVYAIAYILVFGGGLILLARLVRTVPGVEPSVPAEAARGSHRPLSAVVEDAEQEPVP